MPDPSKDQVQEVLRRARALTEAHWGTTNLDVGCEGMDSWMCASVAIGSSTSEDYLGELSIAAHSAFLLGAGVPIPDGEGAVLEAVYAFNDAQRDKEPVIAAFDRAIEGVDAPTPETDAFLDVLIACDTAAAVVARQIACRRPDLPSRELRSFVSSELFYAAQDACEACLLSEVGFS